MPRLISALVALAAGVLSVGLLARSPIAAQTPPTRVFGTVTVDGRPAPLGTTVVALIGDRRCGEGVVRFVNDQLPQGYVVDVLAFAVTQGCGTDGDTIRFLVGGVAARETAEFQTGNFVRLDLTVTGQAATPTPGPTPPPFGTPAGTPTPVPTVAPTAGITLTPAPSPATPLPTPSPAPSPSPTATATPAVTGTATPTPGPTPEQTVTATVAASPGATGTPAPFTSPTPRAMPGTTAGTGGNGDDSTTAAWIAGGLAALAAIVGLSAYLVRRRSMRGM